MTHNLTQKLSKIEISLNRLRSRKSAAEFKMKKQKNNQRKMRTRTLIQLGGLIHITPLPAICGIELGYDLQLEYPDKAAALLGILVTFVNQLPDNISEDDLSRFRDIGVKFLKRSGKHARNIVGN